MAVTAVPTNSKPAWGIVYTHVTDSSADWAAVSNSTYFYDKADGLVHYKNSSGVVEELFGGADTNFATTDLTLTGARTHDLANNVLSLKPYIAGGSNNRIDISRNGGNSTMKFYSNGPADGIIAAINTNGVGGGAINGFYAQATVLVGSQIRLERTGTINSRLLIQRSGFGYVQLGDTYDNYINRNLLVGDNGTASARLHITGSGATSATKSLLVENSAGTDALVITDDGKSDFKNNRVVNAMVDPNLQEVASTATFTIDADTENLGVITAQAVALTVAAPTGTPVQGQTLAFRFKDNGTARAITWNAIFRAIGVTLPTTTTISKTLYILCMYNSTDTKWDVLTVQEEA